MYRMYGPLVGINSCLNLAVCIYDSSWKDDAYLIQQLKEHNSKRIRLQETLSYVKLYFTHSSWTLITLNRRLRILQHLSS